MTGEKVLEVIEIYRSYFLKNHVPKLEYDKEDLFPQTRQKSIETLSHCYWMLDEMEKFITEKQMDKVFRWLGFIQGVLWTEGYFSIEEMANHNRPNVSETESKNEQKPNC